MCDKCKKELPNDSRMTRPTEITVNIMNLPTKNGMSSGGFKFDLCPKHAKKFAEYLSKHYNRELP